MGTVIGFNAGVITGLNVLVPSRDRKDRQPIVYLLGASSGVIAFALWGVWTVSQLLRESFLSNAGFQIIRRNVTNRVLFLGIIRFVMRSPFLVAIALLFEFLY